MLVGYFVQLEQIFEQVFYSGLWLHLQYDFLDLVAACLGTTHQHYSHLIHSYNFISSHYYPTSPITIPPPHRNHSKSILNTSQSLIRNCPFGWPVKAKLDSGLRMYLPLLQLMGNSAFDLYLLPLSTMQMSQQPKMGPLSGLLAMANCARFRLNFSLMFKEKMKDFRDLSAAHCFFAELQAMGVYPPITLPYSVSTRVSVPDCPSHFLWNSLMEKPFSEARQSSFREDILPSKSLLMAVTSLTTLLLRMLTCVLISGTVEATETFSRLVPGLRQRSLVFSNSSLISSWSAAISLSTILGISTLLEEYISLKMGLIQFPLICVKLFSVRFLMNFMTSMPKPQVFTQILNLECSFLILLSTCRNMLSILSRRQVNSCDLRLGLSQIRDQTQDHCTFSQFQWKRQHSSLLQKPASQMRPGLRQFGFVQRAKAGRPQTHSGPWTRG